MADVENQPDSSFPVKRKQDLFCQDQDNVANKAQKLNPNPAESESKDGEISGSGIEILNSSTKEKILAETSISHDKAAGSESERDENGVAGNRGAEEEQEGVDGDDEDEDEDEEDEDEEEEEEEDYSIEPETDRKGKGISREDKGKGKLIEVDESDDEDDSDEDEEGGDKDDESDFSDDPLAEVDLDNILPSRTRRRSIQPGVYISNEISNRGGNNDDGDSSDDSDA